MKILNISKFLIVGFIAGLFNNHSEALDLRSMNGNPYRQTQNSFPTAQIISSLIGILSNTIANEPSETHYQKDYTGGRTRQGSSRQFRPYTRTHASQRPQNYRLNNQMYNFDNQRRENRRRYDHAGISQRNKSTQNRGRTSRVPFQHKQPQSNPNAVPQMLGHDTCSYTY